jgi:hypothetical protein
MGNGRPRPLNDSRRGQHHTRSSPAGDGHGERCKLRLQLLELLFKAHGLGDLHQGRLSCLALRRVTGRKLTYHHRHRRGRLVSGGLILETFELVFCRETVGLWGRWRGWNEEGSKRGRGLAHASNSAFSALVRVSFGLSVEMHGRIVELAPSVVPPKRSSRRCVDFFTALFFFGPLVMPPSRGPRCFLRAPGRRLWGKSVSGVER